MCVTIPGVLSDANPYDYASKLHCPSDGSPLSVFEIRTTTGSLSCQFPTRHLVLCGYGPQTTATTRIWRDNDGDVVIVINGADLVDSTLMISAQMTIPAAYIQDYFIQLGFVAQLC